MHGDYTLGTAAHSRGKAVCIEEECLGIYIYEHGDRPNPENRGDSSDKGRGRYQDLVAGYGPQCEQGELYGHGSVGDSKEVIASKIAFEIALEPTCLFFGPIFLLAPGPDP